ncbi:MAG TPA: hypothetical protein PK677_16540 [Acidiphilium sp.]|nr:MAG: hypothetical protein B7Z67_05450 [Acidiphilium sp. 21-60-14]OYV92564.1 MAG: hypothetical protein B7Z57_00615 [Acidiphilium sp. 37-60-79]OZB39092.1 MAG: hypothetical protein B7X48_10395 [Acidiphilium sp. 34-60-192]HQT90118.1 hypothetical protein [Acidiphilium sp.]HQU25256.1 hypothetical protein [Acidiphilium sp.]
MNATLATEFDRFLFAPIGEGSNGVSISVLSALARQNIDPWQEAAELARMPSNGAIDRLTSHITTLPEHAHGANAKAIAQRCIALLPNRPIIERPGALISASAEKLPLFNTDYLVVPHPKEILFIVVVLVAASIGFHYWAAHNGMPSAQATSSPIVGLRKN